MSAIDIHASCSNIYKRLLVEPFDLELFRFYFIYNIGIMLSMNIVSV